VNIKVGVPCRGRDGTSFSAEMVRTRFSVMGRLAVTIECGGAGFLKIGLAIAALEEEAAGLSAAFY
jgi:hypothetical protein